MKEDDSFDKECGASKGEGEGGVVTHWWQRHSSYHNSCHGSIHLGEVCWRTLCNRQRRRRSMLHLHLQCVIKVYSTSSITMNTSIKAGNRWIWEESLMGTWCIANLSSNKVCHVVGQNWVFLEGCHQESTLCRQQCVRGGEQCECWRVQKVWCSDCENTHDLNTHIHKWLKGPSRGQNTSSTNSPWSRFAQNEFAHATLSPLLCSGRTLGCR